MDQSYRADCNQLANALSLMNHIGEERTLLAALIASTVPVQQADISPNTNDGNEIVVHNIKLEGREGFEVSKNEIVTGDDFSFAHNYEDTFEAFIRDKNNEPSCETTQQGSDVYQSEINEDFDEQPMGTEAPEDDTWLEAQNELVKDAEATQ